MIEILGRVDEYGRALIPIAFSNPLGTQSHTAEVWIDTGFTGHLLLTPEVYTALGITPSGQMPIVQSDGIPQTRNTYRCDIAWLGGPRTITALSGTTKFPLIGVHLLANAILTIDYHLDTVRLQLPAHPAPAEYIS